MRRAATFSKSFVTSSKRPATAAHSIAFASARVTPSSPSGGFNSPPFAQDFVSNYGVLNVYSSALNPQRSPGSIKDLRVRSDCDLVAIWLKRTPWSCGFEWSRRTRQVPEATR